MAAADQVHRRQLAVRPMRDDEANKVDQIMRTAFDKQIGVEGAFGGASYMARRHAGVGLVVEVDGQLAGSAFANMWGSCGLVGPVSVHPEYWNSGAATALMRAVMGVFADAGVGHVELFTFPTSYKHHRLYEKSGLEQAMLNYGMTLPVDHHHHHHHHQQQQQQQSSAAGGEGAPANAVRLTSLSADEAADAYAECRELCSTLNPGFDITNELKTVRDCSLGECLLLWGTDDAGARRLDGVAAVHSGNVPSSEAKTGTCNVKVAVARHRAALEALVRAAMAYTAEQGCKELDAGINTACRQAYLTAMSLGFKVGVIGINMQTPGLLAPGAATHNKYDSYLLMDTR